MRRICSVALLAVCVPTLASCGGKETPCDGVSYPGNFAGTAAGDVDGKSFAASISVVKGTPQESQLDYQGTMEGTGVSAGFRAEVRLGVSCATGSLVVVKGWSQVPAVGTDYPRGDISGALRPDGGTGTWSCTTGCKGGGTWSLK